jgi:phospholipid/cholesterol/gamma-HCH transport system substrate-binding protein
MRTAQRVSWAKFRVSAVTIVALLILGTVAFLLTGGTLFEPKSILYLYIPDGTGLLAGLPVRVNGIGVGKVASVGLSGSTNPTRMVKVTMSVERERLASIAPDSTAQVGSDTAIGDKFIAITGGTRPDHVRPNDEIQYKGSEELEKTLDIVQFQKQVDAIDAMIRDIEQGKNLVGEFVNGDQIYRHLLARVDEVERAVKAVANTHDAVGRELFTDRLFQQIHAPLTELDNRLAQWQAGQGSTGKLLRSPAQYEEMRDRLGKLRSTMADLKKSPMLNSEQAYTDWNRQVASLVQRVDEFSANPMIVTSAIYDNLAGAAKEMQREAKEFRENPRKFLRLKIF